MSRTKEAALKLRGWCLALFLFTAGVSCSPETNRRQDSQPPPELTVSHSFANTPKLASVPISIAVDLPESLLASAISGRLLLQLEGEGLRSPAPAQFEAKSPDLATGLLWFFPPPVEARDGSLRLAGIATDETARMKVAWDPDLRRADVFEEDKPVLRYNQGRTEVPDGVEARFERGNYVSRLFGLDAGPLTEDYPAGHPHHRGVNWSWATVRWKGEERDFFALRGGRADPVRLRRVLEGPVFALIDADNQWIWDNGEAIVGERVLIRAFRAMGGMRSIDLELFLTPLVDDLEFAGRLPGEFSADGYGGFNIRMSPATGQEISTHVDPPEARPRRAWANYSARFGSVKQTSGLTILQHAGNPMYPAEWLVYSNLNFFQPSYPGNRLTPMRKGETVTLRFRLIVHSNKPGADLLAELWDGYNLAAPPKAGEGTSNVSSHSRKGH